MPKQTPGPMSLSHSHEIMKFRIVTNLNKRWKGTLPKKMTISDMSLTVTIAKVYAVLISLLSFTVLAELLGDWPMRILWRALGLTSAQCETEPLSGDLLLRQCAPKKSVTVTEKETVQTWRQLASLAVL